MRRFSVALASVARTFSRAAADSIVGAIVVCSIAAPCGVAPSWLTSKPRRSQGFAIATRAASGAPGARASSMARVAPS